MQVQVLLPAASKEDEKDILTKTPILSGFSYFKYPIIAAKENTIYPLLRRLLKEDYISSSWQKGIEGLTPRKYYSLTDKGQKYIAAMCVEWENLLNAVNEIKGE